MLIYYYLVFYKYLGIKNICVPMENMSRDLHWKMASSEMIFHWHWYDGFALIIQRVCMLPLLTRQLPVWHPHPSHPKEKKKSIKKFTLLESANCCHHLGKLPAQELPQNQTQESHPPCQQWMTSCFYTPWQAPEKSVFSHGQFSYLWDELRITIAFISKCGRFWFAG